MADPIPHSLLENAKRGRSRQAPGSSKSVPIMTTLATLAEPSWSADFCCRNTDHANSGGVKSGESLAKVFRDGRESGRPSGARPVPRNFLRHAQSAFLTNLARRFPAIASPRDCKSAILTMQPHGLLPVLVEFLTELANAQSRSTPGGSGIDLPSRCGSASIDRKGLGAKTRICLAGFAGGRRSLARDLRNREP
jgi:hypothetical protein